MINDPFKTKDMIGLIDCNSFFASCEIIAKPWLEGKPVVVLSNNDGCAIAMSKEAKKIGIKMGTPWFQLKKEAEQLGIIALSSNYELYADISNRIMTRLGRYSNTQEVYSIDECFITIPKLNTRKNDFQTLREFGEFIRQDIYSAVGVRVSIGISPTKTLCKVFNHKAKKFDSLNGVMTSEDFGNNMDDIKFVNMLKTTPVSDIWGVGRAMTSKLVKRGITSIWDLKEMDEQLAKRLYSVNLVRTIKELNGHPCIDIRSVDKPKQQIIFSRAFSKPIKGLQEMEQAFSIYSQNIAQKLIKQNSISKTISIYASSSRFADEKYHSSFFLSATSSVGTSNPIVINKVCQGLLKKCFEHGAWYNRCGIILSDISNINTEPVVLPSFSIDQNINKVSNAIAGIQSKFGESSLGLGRGGIKKRPSWFMKREILSKRFTTHIDEVIIAN